MRSLGWWMVGWLLGGAAGCALKFDDYSLGDPHPGEHQGGSSGLGGESGLGGTVTGGLGGSVTPMGGVSQAGMANAGAGGGGVGGLGGGWTGGAAGGGAETVGGASVGGGNAGQAGGSGTTGGAAAGRAATGGAPTGGISVIGGTAAMGGAAGSGGSPAAGSAGQPTGGTATGGSPILGGAPASGGSGGSAGSCSSNCGDAVCERGCETALTCPLDCGPIWLTDGDVRRVEVNGDWAPGEYIAECGLEPLIGLSVASTGPATMHAALCGFDDAAMFPHVACTALSFTSDNNRLDVATGDWDPGAYKGECAQDGYVAGVARNSSGVIDTILCCTGNGLGHTSCAARSMWLGNALEAGGGVTTGDWDPGYYKGECGPGRYVAGVSNNPANGTRAILCCEP